MDNYTLYDPAYVPAAEGFINTGVICWFNSMVQFMLGMPSLNKVLIDNSDDFESNKFAKAYISMVRPALRGFCPMFEHHSSYLFKLLMEKLTADGRQDILGYGQECADEAFTAIVDLMFNHPKVHELFRIHYNVSVSCTLCGHENRIPTDRQFRIDLFTNADMDTPTRFCEYIRSHVSDCEQYRCDRCNGVSPRAIRTEKLGRLGEIVVITLDKFQEKTPRYFPNELAFNKIGGGMLRYRLIGKIDHAGNRFGGHYWAHSVRGGEWKKINDKSVSTGGPECEPETFMVAYHMIPDY